MVRHLVKGRVLAQAAKKHLGLVGEAAEELQALHAQAVRVAGRAGLAALLNPCCFRRLALHYDSGGEQEFKFLIVQNKSYKFVLLKFKFSLTTRHNFIVLLSQGPERGWCINKKVKKVRFLSSKKKEINFRTSYLAQFVAF